MSTPAEGQGRLGPVPARLVETRLALHRLAEQVISPARRQATGRIGLRATPGGFGTPRFGEDVRVRVAGAELVLERGDAESRAPITTLAAAAELVGHDLLPDDVQLDDRPLAVDADAAAFLGDWYGFADAVLEELRAEAPDGEDTLVQLWPEHFDMAVELGSEADGARAAYGLSPGDELHPEPYVYVAPWQPPPAGPLWRATAFTGAELPYAELLATADPHAAALAFMRERLAALTR